MTIKIPAHYGYDSDKLSALEAITEAQKIAFAPMLFQAAVNLRDQGILAYLDQQGKKGAAFDEVLAASPLSSYATELLLDVGMSVHLLYLNDGRYYLGKAGYYLLHDKMTRINMDFTQDVCYQGLAALRESLQETRPAGLAVFGQWDTIYPALSSLPEPARSSWFAYDHFYSDAAFGAALPHVFALKPAHLYDVGGNTGKWSLRCCAYDPDVQVTILDLPQQITLAESNIAEKGLSHRIKGHPVNLLGDAPLPGEADVWWMSQFLDCFSEEQIIAILSKIHAAAKPDARVCILETLWNCQQFEAGALSLNASSLYFTAMANGNSRFYSAEAFDRCIQAAGFEIEKRVDGLGLGHSLMICRKK
ncbi:MAG: SAM-dependent methyltransferase [Marinospirillum sp.]|uniref:methyltransferase n=1 Tax=Marinospirillum sp. TaxID=2183934 RepID=UPI0019FFBE31|nr:methyltransferase [Marinospirillum sp.]MBE0506875.1 SAM-dependent methyltransferase [Marinospirillum sp.]